jgi:preprotein translocase SecE subunit
MEGLIQYFKDTRAELRHVAWPTQTQTIVYTLLVAGISLATAAYLGFFDFLFTTGLTALVNNASAAPAATEQQATTTPITGTPINITPPTVNTSPATTK